MEKAKRKHDNPHRYWRVFLPLALILGLMVKFPVRILIGESVCDILLYGGISLTCLATAVRNYRRFGQARQHLTAVIVLCVLLSGWQVFDLAILRDGFFPVHYGAGFGRGNAWYNLRFPNDSILCPSLVEYYYGNHMIAIAYEIDRDVSLFTCVW